MQEIGMHGASFRLFLYAFMAMYAGSEANLFGLKNYDKDSAVEKYGSRLLPT
jgi:hypothetical protein